MKSYENRLKTSVLRRFLVRVGRLELRPHAPKPCALTIALHPDVGPTMRWALNATDHSPGPARCRRSCHRYPQAGLAYRCPSSFLRHLKRQVAMLGNLTQNKAAKQGGGNSSNYAKNKSLHGALTSFQGNGSPVRAVYMTSSSSRNIFGFAM